MKSEIMQPMYASREKPVNFAISAPAKTPAERKASFLASSPDAMSDLLSVSFPCFFTQAPRMNFTNTAVATIAMVTVEYSAFCG